MGYNHFRPTSVAYVSEIFGGGPTSKEVGKYLGGHDAKTRSKVVRKEIRTEPVIDVGKLAIFRDSAISRKFPLRMFHFWTRFVEVLLMLGKELHWQLIHFYQTFFIKV